MTDQCILSFRCSLLTFGCLTVFPLILTGCADTHPDEFQEFSNLPAVESDTAEEGAAETDETVEERAAETSPDVAIETVPATGAVVSEPVIAEVKSEDVSADENAKPETTDSSPEGTPATPVASETEAANAQPIKLLIPHRQFRMEGKSVRATFDDIDLLKVLNMDPVPRDAAEHFPDWLSDLNGKKVRIRGYMRPDFYIEDITEFLFVRDNGECCYGPLPKIYDMIAVQLADGESTDLIEGTPFDVEGTFRIEPHTDEVELYALFFIDEGVIIE